VLAQISQERFSRWPVVDARTGRPTGYLLATDLIEQADDADWTRLVRPLTAIRPQDTIESILTRMQGEAAKVYVVEDGGRAVGLITLEDLLEQVVGQIVDEYPHEVRVSLRDAVASGGVVLGLEAETRDAAIAELARLAAPVVVFGRSGEGVVFAPHSAEPVRLVFLLVTPAEQPEVHLALLAQLAQVAGTEEGRRALLRASFPGDVAEILNPRPGR
jgi:predicted transcriptional regulator